MAGVAGADVFRRHRPDRWRCCSSLGYWFRSGDRHVRGRVYAARYGDFIAPPPGAAGRARSTGARLLRPSARTLRNRLSEGPRRPSGRRDRGRNACCARRIACYTDTDGFPSCRTRNLQPCPPISNVPHPRRDAQDDRRAQGRRRRVPGPDEDLVVWMLSAVLHVGMLRPSATSSMFIGLDKAPARRHHRRAPSSPRSMRTPHDTDLSNIDIGSDPTLQLNYNVDRIEDVSVPGPVDPTAGRRHPRRPRGDAAERPGAARRRRRHRGRRPVA